MASVSAVGDDEAERVDASEIWVRPVDQILSEPLERPVHGHARDPVIELITVGVGYEDWEWGVTLWARNPEFLKDIVYRMRFDEASARYAEFGPFYTSYIMSPAEMLDHCRIA